MADALLTSPLPADVGQAIRTVKAQLRRQIGRTVPAHRLRVSGCVSPRALPRSAG